MNLLVTGGAGFIGSHFIVDALKKDHSIVAIDNFSTSNKDNLDKIKDASGKDFTFFESDISDRTKLREIFSKNNIDLVVHFASLKSVTESVFNPIIYYKNNVCGSLILFETMQEMGVNKIIFSSSASVYGSSHLSPISEKCSLNPISPYAQSKAIIETILNDMTACKKDFKALNLRYFNPVGCHESFLIGESSKIKPSNLFPVICSVANGKKSHLSIFGKDYDTHDGTPVRDYIHISDLISGHISAIDWLNSSKKNFSSINLGTGSGYSVLEIVNVFNSFLDKPIQYEYSPRRSGDPGEVFADNSLAKSELNWSCAQSLEKMCKDSWLWHSKD
jgi:UDP-glucose 4-epimerase